MKRFFLLFIFSLLGATALTTTSCSEKEEPKQSLVLSTQTVAINTAGEVQQIAITTNQPTWTASRPNDDSWCILEQGGGNVLRISAEAQTATTPRNTVITITAGTMTATISVTQAGSAPSLTLDKQNLELDVTGAAQTVTVTTNLGAWSATRPEADDWCTLAMEGNTLSISATLCFEQERSTTVTVAAVDGDGFSQPIAVVQKGGVIAYEVTIPTDFSECAVKKVIYNNVKVAEICSEYIRTPNKQMTVIYPVSKGITDLTQGVDAATGGQVVWDLATNTCTYTAGSETTPLTKVWIEGGVVKTENQNNVVFAATVASDLLVDIRGTSSEVYRIVKIGTQYWMADNLRAERYLDGSVISTTWKDNTTGAYCYLFNTPADYKATYGAIYNGFATLNTAGLAPEGWTIPNNAAWTKLRTYIGTPYGTKLKAKSGWSTGNGSGITGFNALPAQSYNTATGFVDSPVETWLWSTDQTYDPLTKKNSQFYARMTDTSTGMVFNTDTSFGSFHGQEFGHSVRCLRK